jgi:hypothetical protein
MSNGLIQVSHLVEPTDYKGNNVDFILALASQMLTFGMIHQRLLQFLQK